MTETPTELVLEEVVEVAPGELSEEQTTFIKENAEGLTDEQKETFKEVLEAEEEEEKEIDLEKVTPESREGEPEPPKPDVKPDEEEDVAPEDEEAIGKVVDKRIEPITKALGEVQKIKDQAEVDSFIRVKPEFEKYRAVALKYMAHPAYKNVPVNNIMSIVAGKDLQKLGAQKERDAKKKADDTKSPGDPVREPGKGKVDWKKAPKADFDAQRQKVLGQQG